MKKTIIVLFFIVLLSVIALEVVTLVNIIKVNQNLNFEIMETID